MKQEYIDFSAKMTQILWNFWDTLQVFFAYQCGSTYINWWMEYIFSHSNHMERHSNEPGTYWFFSQMTHILWNFWDTLKVFFSFQNGSTYINWWMEYIFSHSNPIWSLKSKPGKYWFFNQNDTNSIEFFRHPVIIFFIPTWFHIHK